MATYFIDIDGTLTYEGTNQFLPQADLFLKMLAMRGHQVVLTTARPRIGSADLIRRVRELVDDDATVIFGVSSPRILINNEGAHAIKHKTDSDWSQQDIMRAIALGQE